MEDLASVSLNKSFAMLQTAIENITCSLIDDFGVDRGHLTKTPRRVSDAYRELLSGYLEAPNEVLSMAMFPTNEDDGMVVIKEIPFTSLCQHHMIPFFGKAWFGYIPGKHIVGLSKIPRIVDIFSRRLQVQEHLGAEVVNTFMEVVKPLGCGIVIDAVHMCMCARGFKQQGMITGTSSLRGVFKDVPSTKQEFMERIK